MIQDKGHATWRKAEERWYTQLVRCFGKEAMYYRYSSPWTRDRHPAYDETARAAEQACEAAFLKGTAT